VSAVSFMDALAKAGDVDAIDLYINSPGGDVFDGTAIYNQLARHKAHVVVHIDGIAASIASIVAMAGDTIKIADNGMMMVHNPWVMTAGNAAELRKQADVLDQVATTMVGTYVARTKQTPEYVAMLMAAESWLTSDDAVAAGFADAKSDAVKMAANYDLSRFKNVPKQLLAVVGNTPQPERVLSLEERIANQFLFLQQLRERRK